MAFFHTPYFFRLMQQKARRQRQAREDALVWQRTRAAYPPPVRAPEPVQATGTHDRIEQWLKGDDKGDDISTQPTMRVNRVKMPILPQTPRPAMERPAHIPPSRYVTQPLDISRITGPLPPIMPTCAPGTPVVPDVQIDQHVLILVREAIETYRSTHTNGLPVTIRVSMPIYEVMWRMRREYYYYRGTGPGIPIEADAALRGDEIVCHAPVWH